MIILLGPDNAGKSTLAKRIVAQHQDVHTLGGVIQRRLYAANKDTTYQEYIFSLTKVAARYGVMDRWFFCEYPYSEVVRENDPKFTLKQMHNLFWMTMAHAPVFILCTTYRSDAQWEGEYSTPSQFEDLLSSYRRWLDYFGVTYFEYDVKQGKKKKALLMKQVYTQERANLNRTAWWNEHLNNGYFGIGSHSARVMYLAEELSPNNKNLLPFEAGPSGRYLSKVFEDQEIPLDQVWLTNMKKTPSDTLNRQLFEREITAIRPRAVVLMGKVATQAIPLLDKHQVPYYKVTHPSSIIRFHPDDAPRYAESFRETFNKAWSTADRLQGGQKNGWQFRTE